MIIRESIWIITIRFIICLVVEKPILKNDGLRQYHEIPTEKWKHIKTMFQTTNQSIIIHYSWFITLW